MAAQIGVARPGTPVELIEGSGGDFIVLVHAGESTTELWNKNASGRGFPEPDAIIDQLP